MLISALLAEKNEHLEQYEMAFQNIKKERDEALAALADLNKNYAVLVLANQETNAALAELDEQIKFLTEPSPDEKKLPGPCLVPDYARFYRVEKLRTSELRKQLTEKERECALLIGQLAGCGVRKLRVDNAALRKLCVEEEKQLSKIAWLADNATATHLLLICDRLKAAAEGNG